MTRRTLGTIRRGKVKIKTEKQMRYLHVHKIDHTHYVTRKGKLVKRRHTY